MKNKLNTFCIIAIDGKFNKFSLNFSKINSSNCFAIDSREKINEDELKKLVENFDNIIITLAFGGSHANKILLKVIEFFEDKKLLVVANTPFSIEGKRKKLISKEIINILDIKNINTMIFYSDNLLNFVTDNKPCSIRDFFAIIDAIKIKNINKVINANI